MLKEVEVIGAAVIKAMLCGSRVTCVPAPTDTDQDVIVLVRDINDTAKDSKHPKHYKEYVKSIEVPLMSAGYVCGGSGEGDDEFESWTKGEVNLILTADPNFYARFVAATTVARRLNILDKEDRKALFRSVLYSEPCYVTDETGLEMGRGGVPF